MTAPLPRPGVLDINPYQGGRSKLDGVAHAAKLSSNEGALGASPRARAAYQAVAAELHRYPDGSCEALRAAIGKRHGLDPARIVCGCGADELIGLLVHAYVGPGDEVLYSQYGFAMYPIYAKGNGAVPVKAPERNLTTDVDAVLASVTEKTRMVFIANPNNPTGTMIPASEMKRLRDGLREDIILVIDAAYAEYVTRNDYSAGAELVESTGNTVMTRTFSKIYGLGGLRVGWCYAPAAIADVLNRVRSPFNVTSAAQAAAQAAMEDTQFFDLCLAHNQMWLLWLSEQVRALGFEVTPSCGNFILVHFAPGGAEKAIAALTRHEVIVRPVAGYGLPNALRISVGTEEENRRVVAALAEMKEGAA
jgi:histidinol-phosphate aminotransferase